MSVSVAQAKERLDYIINIARSDMYKPIQIAEVLYHSRHHEDIDILNLETYQNRSIHWRNTITIRLKGKRSTSSARYQHDIWNATAMSPEFLLVLDRENKRTNGLVERYIYVQFQSKHKIIVNMIASLVRATPQDFSLQEFIHLFTKESGMKRSIDKAYEIIVYSLFETIVSGLEATISINVPEKKHALLREFTDLAQVLLGIDQHNTYREMPAHIYRVGVTNAADRGLDMWTNFGPAIQVKHITLNTEQAQDVVEHIESDHIVIVCKDTDKSLIETILKQIGWGRRVRGIVTEHELLIWYEKCLRGAFSTELGQNLLNLLVEHFRKEFPQVETLVEFMEERSYTSMIPTETWSVE